MDKKSIIQIAILLVLIVGGGAVYLSRQEDGLDIGTIIGDLISGAPETPAPTPVTVAPKPAEPQIPAHPAKGEVGGGPFEPDSVAFEGGVLAFVQSKDPQTALLIQVAGPKWETPIGKKFRYAPAGAGSPPITVSRLSNGEMKPQTYSDKYTLVLEFGQESNRRLAGKLRLEVPGNPRTVLAGTFDADIKGFRFVDGKPDLNADSTETLQYLALRELLKDDPDKQIEVLAFRDGRYGSDGAARNHTGYIEVEYRIAQGEPQIKRYQFVKDAEWKLRGALALNQIDEAHPLTAPGPKDSPNSILSYLAAKRLEADVKKKAPKKGIYGVNLVTRHSAKTKLGVAEASYKTEPEGPAAKTAYLFRLKQSGWVLDRELTAKEKVNVESGKIEKL